MVVFTPGAPSWSLVASNPPDRNGQSTRPSVAEVTNNNSTSVPFTHAQPTVLTSDDDDDDQPTYERFTKAEADTFG